MRIGKYVIAAVGLLLVFLIGKYLRRRAIRKQLLAAPFPAEWEQIVQKNVPLYSRLPEQLSKQFGGLGFWERNMRLCKRRRDTPNSMTN